MWNHVPKFNLTADGSYPGDWAALMQQLELGQVHLDYAAYFICGPGPSREFWFAVNDCPDLYIVLHVHYATEDGIVTTSDRPARVNARFSVPSELANCRKESAFSRKLPVTEHDREQPAALGHGIASTGARLTPDYRHSDPGPGCMGEGWRHVADMVTIDLEEEDKIREQE